MLAEERADVGERAEVAQLVGVNDGADRLHDAVGDVEREDVDDPLLGVEQDRAGLAVHLVQLDADAQAGELASPAGEEAADTVAADDRARPGRRLAAAVAVDDDIRGEHVDQRLDVAVLDGGEEALRESLSLLARRLEARLLLLDPAPCARRQLAAVVLALADDLRDLVVAVAEDVVEQEDGPLDRRQLLEQDEERERERVRLLGVVRRIEPRTIVGQKRLGQPLAHVHLAAGPRRAQVIDAEPRHDRRQERLRRLDLGALGERTLLAQKSLLDDVLRLADAAQHAIGEREQ